LKIDAKTRRIISKNPRDKPSSMKKQQRFRYILAGLIYETSPEFIETAESLTRIIYMILHVPENILYWLKLPERRKKIYKYKGKKKDGL